jgi:P22 tail accessory factor
MSWKKKQLVEKAYGSFGLTRFAFTLTPEMVSDGIASLDAMMARWGTELGIRIGYNNAATPADANAEQESGIPDHAAQAVYLMLGGELADQVGKQQSAQTIKRRDDAFDSLLSWVQAAQVPSMQFRRNTPVGAGNKPEQNGVVGVFFQPAGQLEAGADSYLEGEGGTPLLTGNGGGEL